MIKAAIYDLDDLLVNSIGLHIQSSEQVLNKYGASSQDMPDSLQRRFIGMKIVDVYRLIISHLNIPVKPEKLELEKEKIFLELVRDKLELMPGVIRSLWIFHEEKLKIALATSGTRPYVQLVLDKFNLKPDFEVIITGDDVHLGKPDPETFTMAINKLGLKPEECLVLEDATNGIEAAKAAGCLCIAVKNPYTPVQDLSQADLIINSLSDLSLEIINSLA
ncbi:MAG: HAD family phosphatase [bacterium]